MRFALIIAFVSSVFFATDASAAPGGADRVAQARKPPKAHKRRAARTPKKAKSTSKASRKAKVKAEEVAVADEADVETPDPAPAVESMVSSKRAPVEQATDDEEPPSGPKKKR